MEPTQFVVVVIISAADENVGHPGDASIGYVFKHDRDLDVALFPSWLQGVTRKSVEKSESSLFEPCNCFPVWNLVDGEILDLERG